MDELETGMTLIPNFINTGVMFDYFKNNVNWDESMKARKTASFGVAYNYSQIKYTRKKFDTTLSFLINRIEDVLKFKPNNCLINYYLDGKSKMGYHSDQIDILYEGTGVAIISLGETRIIRFRRIDDKSITKDFELKDGSLFYMTQEVQKTWNHCIPKSSTEESRMSLTFRHINEK